MYFHYLFEEIINNNNINNILHVGLKIYSFYLSYVYVKEEAD